MTLAHLSPAARDLIEQRAKLAGVSDTRIPRYPNTGSWPLSFVQQGVWLSTQLYKSTSAFNRCSAIRITGPLHIDALQWALREIVRRHETLRTRVTIESGVPRMCAMEVEEVAVPIVDLSDVPAEDRKTRVTELLDVEVKKSFDLQTGPWLRAGILREDAERNTLFITTQHIATDGWSDAVMFRELDLLYSSYLHGDKPALAEPSRQFRDFAHWQHERAAAAEGFRDVEYWRERLAGAPAGQDLPTDYPRPDIPRMESGQVTRRIPSQLSKTLAEIGRTEGATPAITSLAAFMLLQSRITNQLDTVVGLSLSGRTRPELEQLIGLFSEVVPIRVQVEREMTFRELVRAVRVAVLEAHEHQHVSVDAILEALPSAQGVVRREIAETLFNYRNMPAFAPSLEGADVESLSVFNGSSVADLDLEVIEQRDGWRCDLRFRTALFEETTATRFLGHFTTLLESIARNPDELVARLGLLTPEERKQLLVEFMGPRRELPKVLRLDDLIRTQAGKTPHAIAVATEDRALTYEELDRKSDSLAAHLQSRSVTAGDRVGIRIARSIEMLVSIIAVLKSGAAFVPLDPEYPQGRLAHMLADTSPVLLLADRQGVSMLGSPEVQTMLIDADVLNALDSRKPEQYDVDTAEVACVLYTSGSTGLPKGVLSTHRGIANNLLAMQELYPVASEDCVLHHTSIGFDAAAWEIFRPLMVGARIFLARPGGQRHADYLIRTIREQHIRDVGTAPSMLRVMLDIPEFAECAQIRRVLCYGEVLSPAVREKFYRQKPQAILGNLYGPTEASVTVTAWTCVRGSKRRSVPIGRPMANCEIYILDEGLEPVPIGAPGELYIGGVCVSNGYHNRPELTAERFPPHPFRPGTGERVYRTGDIARFTADGVIEYVGRRDHQLKIRGVRVELEEIEAALERLPAVRESVVIAQPVGGEDYKLIAYAAVNDPKTLPNDLRAALEHDLPPQFIPSTIVRLAELPHGPNGKIDRSALPDASEFVQERPAEKHLPSTGDEMRVASIWKEMLDILDVGTRESFFTLGGHSLLAVRMVQRVNDEFGSQVSLRSFYEEPTIAGLATRLSGNGASTATARRTRLFKVREKTDRATLFYFNGQPAGGGRYAHRFGPYLPRDRGFTLVPLPILSRPTTVEEIAEQVIGIIRNEQPSGPYLLGGNCFGATLALEVAHQLTSAGENVPLVALVHPDALARTHLWYRLMRRLALMAGVPEEFHTAEFTSVLDHTRRTLAAVWTAQQKMSWRERLNRWINAGRWTRQFVYATRIPLRDEENDCMSQESELVAHRRFMEDAWIAYTLRPYAGKVGIVWPLEGPSNPPWNPRALWKHFTPQFDWRDVPGNHWTMLHEHFEDSARALGDFVSRAGS